MTLPRNVLDVSLRITAQGAEYIDKKEQKRWNVRIPNPFAMFSTLLQQQGTLTEEDLARERAKYQAGSDFHLCREVDEVVTELGGSGHGKTIWIIGVGHADDAGFVRYAMQKGFTVKFADHSMPALQNALALLASISEEAAIEENVVMADIIYVLKELLRTRDVWLHFGRIWHHLPPRKLRQIPRLIADFLSDAPIRRVTLIHPNTRHNLQWVGRYQSVKRVFDIEDQVSKITKALERKGSRVTGPNLSAWIPRQSEEPFDAFLELFTAATIMLRSEQ